MEQASEHVNLFAETLPLAYRDIGQGRPYLILHGGAGPNSVGGLAGALAANSRTIVPTHPGFAGEPRPDWLSTVPDLAQAYLGLLERLDLRDVIVIGNSIGGWIAAEMALRKSLRVAGIVLLNPVGIDTGSPDKQIVDPLNVSPAERAKLAFHDPARYAIIPAGPEAAAAMAANQQTLRVYAGAPFMHDPGLRARLNDMVSPALVIWGESDGIVDVDYGRQFAASMPGCRFALLPEAGHFPHIEQLDKVVGLIDAFANES
jgi:pimeloyl-ACP methyl ester carboxylesterase